MNPQESLEHERIEHNRLESQMYQAALLRDERSVLAIFAELRASDQRIARLKEQVNGFLGMLSALMLGVGMYLLLSR